MKKVFIAVAALATLTLVSCKKDWSCSCVSTTNGTSGDAQVTTHKEIKKSAATASCHDWESTETFSGTTYTTTVDCTLSKK
jgi:hypothetical protein